jgi:ComF family protein
VQLEWCASFTGPTRAAIHALKYDAERRLARPLGEALARRWSKAGIGGDLLAWVPVHPDRRRQRGFDQAELLARAMGTAAGVPVAGCLARRTRTEAQHALGREARAGNVSGAFVVPHAARGRVVGRWVVLVDDVVTTGATLSGCATAMHEAGALAVSAISVARER